MTVAVPEEVGIMDGELISSMPIDVWTAMKAGSVPDSLRASREWMVHAQRVLGISDPSEAAIQLEQRMSKRGPPADWDATDLQRVRGEYAFAWNWCQAGAPIFNLTHSTAALLSMTRAPAVDFDHAPFPAFLICVPHVYLPLLSDRAVPVRWIAVQSGILMGATGGLVVGVGPDGRLTEDGLEKIGRRAELVEWRRLLGLAVRLTANVIEFVSQYRATDCVQRTSKDGAPTQSFDVRPPKDVVIDRAFRDLAAELVQARDFKGARRALSHIVRGHWRNQPVGPGRADRRLIWIRPFRRGEESFGTVVQRTIRIHEET